MGRKRKWTEKRVKKELERFLDWLRADGKEHPKKPEFIFLGQLFSKAEIPKQNFSMWRKRFSDVPEIRNLQQKIRTILESRLNTGGLKGTLNWHMVQFNLINNYSENWKDTKHLNVSGSLERKVDEKTQEIIAKYLKTNRKK